MSYLMMKVHIPGPRDFVTYLAAFFCYLFWFPIFLFRIEKIKIDN